MSVSVCTRVKLIASGHVFCSTLILGNSPLDWMLLRIYHQLTAGGGSILDL